VWLTRIAEATAESEVRDVFVELARAEIAGVLRLSSAQSLDSRRRLIDLGLDSLMAVELRNRLAKILQLNQPLPATLVFDHPTIEALAAFLYSQVFGSSAAPAAVSLPVQSVSAQQIESMSDEEAELLLVEKLKAFEATS
jgi:acyl carrier protein